jgi:hypothetical protein
MCQTAKSLTFSGKITVNGRTTQYNNQPVPIPAGFSNCLSRQGDKLSIMTKTPIGTFNNTVTDNNGKITGTLRFPGATINLNGSGSFQY